MRGAASLSSLVLALGLVACSSIDAASDPYASDSGLTDLGESSGTEGSDTSEAETATDEGTTLDLPNDDAVACDVWAQDCPAGKKCSWEIVDTVAQPSCVPLVPNAKPPGDPCTTLGDPGSGHDDCELGAMCGWLDLDNAGVCLALCSGSLLEPSCEGTQLPAICQPCSDCPSLCIPTCDPLADTCGAGYACAPNAGNFTCTPAETLGAGMLGDPCEYAVQCAAGFACIDGAAVQGCDQVGCCSPFCSLELPECPNQMSCEPWFEEPQMPPVPDVGVCKGV